MPANWGIYWEHPSFCHDVSASPYGPLAQPYTASIDVEPTAGYETTYSVVKVICWTNTPVTEDFVPTHVTPQVILDDAVPASFSIATLAPVLAADTDTHLYVFDTTLANVGLMTAAGVAPDGSSVVFPYPTNINGSALAPGAYLGEITVDTANTPETANGLEPFYIAHNDHTYPGAYGVAVVTPKEVSTVKTGTYNPSTERCSPLVTSTTTTGGTTIPLVTLLTQGSLAIGSSGNTIAVGANPTVVLPFHDGVTRNIYNPNPDSPCVGIETDMYTGAQSALVVNTGGNSVSIVSVGTEFLPTGTVSVGQQPVAAAINSAETYAYIANYADNTVSEVDLTNLLQTRTISVMTHPSSITFDSNGNLWVGGQGALEDINVGAWSVATTYAVDGTINGMSYDTQQGVLVQTVLQNGSLHLRTPGGTTSNAISFSSALETSYTTQSIFSVASGTSTISTTISGDNSSYSLSSIASMLAFPGQTAFTPPIYTSSDGDVIATVSGTQFTVSVITDGHILVQGSLPYPARGVALTQNMVYFTMPDSNSLLSLPVQLP